MTNRNETVRPAKRGARRSGFTVIEVVVAGGILAAVVGGLFAAVIAAIGTQYMAANYYRATSLARNRIQRAAAQPFDSLPMVAEPQRRIDDYGNPSAQGVYTRQTTVTEITPDVYDVTVRVHYPTGPGKRSSVPVIVQTMIARRMFDGGDL